MEPCGGVRRESGCLFIFRRQVSGDKHSAGVQAKACSGDRKCGAGPFRGCSNCETGRDGDRGSVPAEGKGQDALLGLNMVAKSDAPTKLTEVAQPQQRVSKPTGPKPGCVTLR